MHKAEVAVSKPFRIFALSFACALLLFEASAQLNPLVKRLPQPTRNAPAECDEGLTALPTEPRPLVADIPLPEPAVAEVPPPPSTTLRAQLADVQAALERSDRPAFDAALASVRRTLLDYPRGGERTAAEDAVRVYDDATRAWDAMFAGPFFDRDSDLFKQLNRYEGYEAAMRRQVLSGRYYPARESRDFLAGVARQRLAGVGVRTTRAPSPSASVTPAPRPRPRIDDDGDDDDRAPLPSVRPRSSTPAPSRSSGSPAAARRSSSPTPAAGRSTPAAPRVVHTSTTTAPPAVADIAVTTTTPPPAADPLAVPSSPVVTDTSPGDISSTDTSSTDLSASDTSATTATAVSPAPPTTTSAEAAPPAERSRARKIIIPALLVLVGIVILVMLFRASS